MLGVLTPEGLGQLLLWFLVVVLLALGGFVAAMAVRRWAHREAAGENFTFQDLRELRMRGEISEREYTAMRAALLGKMDAEGVAGREVDPDGGAETRSAGPRDPHNN